MAIALVAIGCQQQSSEPAPTDTNGKAPSTTAQTPNSTEGTNTTPPAGTTVAYSDVQNLFTQKCANCHGIKGKKGGIDLTSYENAMKGGEKGPIIKPGDPEGSVIIMALKGEGGHKRMPMMAAPLPADQIQMVADWIKAGAKA